MRTTITIDDAVLAVARALAARNGTSLGCALSTLARRGFQRPRIEEGSGTPVFRVAGVAEPITSADVRKALGDCHDPASGP